VVVYDVQLVPPPGELLSIMSCLILATDQIGLTV